MRRFHYTRSQGLRAGGFTTVLEPFGYAAVPGFSDRGRRRQTPLYGWSAPFGLFTGHLSPTMVPDARPHRVNWSTSMGWLLFTQAPNQAQIDAFATQRAGGRKPSVRQLSSARGREFCVGVLRRWADLRVWAFQFPHHSALTREVLFYWSDGTLIDFQRAGKPPLGKCSPIQRARLGSSSLKGSYPRAFPHTLKEARFGQPSCFLLSSASRISRDSILTPRDRPRSTRRAFPLLTTAVPHHFTMRCREERDRRVAQALCSELTDTGAQSSSRTIVWDPCGHGESSQDDWIMHDPQASRAASVSLASFFPLNGRARAHSGRLSPLPARGSGSRFCEGHISRLRLSALARSGIPQLPATRGTFLALKVQPHCLVADRAQGIVCH